MTSIRKILSALVVGFSVVSPHAEAAFPTIALKAVCLQQIHSPTTIAYAPDGSGRVFVCDQLGKIYIIQGGMLLPTPFLNIASPSNTLPADRGPGPVLALNTGYSERGLLGLAFHPGFANPLSPGYRKFYVNYTKSYVPGSPDFDPAAAGVGDPVNCVTVIAEFQVSPTDPNVALPGSERRLLRYTQPQSNHNGGQVEFGPDGYLYIGAGDGGGSNDNNAGHAGGSTLLPTNNLGNGQDKTRFLGKILRIDPLDPDGAGPLTYGIPPSNPFVGAGGGVKEEIYSYGMRNPWRFSFDKRPGGTNRLFCGDVGQGRIEEINLIVAGGNYGWHYKEGHEFPTFSSGAPTNPMPDPGNGPYIAPIASYAHPGVTTTSPVLPQLGLSVTGGFVYRGPAIPAMQGKYVFGDYGSTAGASDGRVMGLEEDAPGGGVFTLTQAIPIFGLANPIVNQRILCLGEDESGEIYIGMKTNAGVLALDGGLPAGGIYKIVPIQNVSKPIVAAKDNTIFSDTVPVLPTTGYPSDALGFLYAGRTGTNHGPYLRRALISFDIASQIPAGAVVQSAQLNLRLTKLGPASFGQPMTLHRLTETWGEGFSMNPNDVGTGAQATVGDATWASRFFGTAAWTTLGGTFNATATATSAVAFPTTTFASNAQMVSDVQTWVNSPASNAGWILRGNETLDETAVQISSVQKGPTPPTLQVSYLASAPPTHFESWLATNFPANRIGQYVDPSADFAGDGVSSLVKYAYAFPPFIPLPPEAGIQGVLTTLGANDIFTYTFPRDPLATDLTYEFQSTEDLVTWSTITTSIGGAVSSGPAFVEENGSDILYVTVREIFPSPAKRFVRLRITRTQ